MRPNPGNATQGGSIRAVNDIGQEPFEPGVLLLQLAQAFDVVGVHAAKTLPPAIDGVCSRNGKNRTLSPAPERWLTSLGLAQLQANL